MSINLKQKLKSFFKANEGSEHAVELLKYWILPFSRGMRRSGIDDVVTAFFALDDRRFFYARANCDFKLPGKFYIAGARPVYGLGPRAIKKNKTMMIVVDRKDSTAKIEVVMHGTENNYLLEKFEFESIKDKLDVI